MQAEKAALTAYMEGLTEKRPTKAQKAMGGEDKRYHGCRFYWPRGALLRAPGGRSQVPRRYQFWTEKMWKTVRAKDRFCHYCKLETALKTDPILLAAGATSDKDPQASITKPPAATTGGPDLSDPKGVNPDAGPLPTDLPSGGTTKDRPSLITKFLGDVAALNASLKSLLEDGPISGFGPGVSLRACTCAHTCYMCMHARMCVHHASPSGSPLSPSSKQSSTPQHPGLSLLSYLPLFAASPASFCSWAASSPENAM
jgi:hypothetical protein